MQTPPSLPSVLDPGVNPVFAVETDRSGNGNLLSNIIGVTLPNELNPDRDIYVGNNPTDATTAMAAYNRGYMNTAKLHGETIEHAINNSITAGVLGFDFDTLPGDLGTIAIEFAKNWTARCQSPDCRSQCCYRLNFPCPLRIAPQCDLSVLPCQSLPH